jgi:hypothetical protein
MGGSGEDVLDVDPVAEQAAMVEDLG